MLRPGRQDRREFCFASADLDARICADLLDDALKETCVDWTMKGKLREAASPNV
jgi:hypothetical protein